MPDTATSWTCMEATLSLKKAHWLTDWLHVVLDPKNIEEILVTLATSVFLRISSSWNSMQLLRAKQHRVEQLISLRWSWKYGMWWTSRPVARTNTNVITLHSGPDSLCQRLEVVILDRVCRVKIMDRVMTDGQLLIEDNCCTKGHHLKTLTIHRFFICITKYLAKNYTAAANPPIDRPAKKKSFKTGRSTELSVT